MRELAWWMWGTSCARHWTGYTSPHRILPNARISYHTIPSHPIPSWYIVSVLVHFLLSSPTRLLYESCDLASILIIYFVSFNVTFLLYLLFPSKLYQRVSMGLAVKDWSAHSTQWTPRMQPYRCRIEVQGLTPLILGDTGRDGVSRDQLILTGILVTEWRHGPTRLIKILSGRFLVLLVVLVVISAATHD